MLKDIQQSDNILGDSHSSIALLNVMGDDLSIVNAARVSFSNFSDSFNARDRNLIKYLIKHDHWSPFRGVVFTFKVSCPLAIARQWYKHTIASSCLDVQNQWNEISMRYVPMEDNFYTPIMFRKQAENNKQASEGYLDANIQSELREVYKKTLDVIKESYDYLLEKGVAREQARFLLPVCTYTSFIWTVSAQALLHFISLRDSPAAQNEIQHYALEIRNLIEDYIPETLTAYDDLRKSDD